MTEIEYRLLGPVEAFAGGRPVALGGARQRTLIAALLLRAGQVVSADALIELIWGEVPPQTARTALHGLVSKLRRALDRGDGSGSSLVSRAPGYALELTDSSLDLEAFSELADDGARALSSGDVARASDRFTRALALWRGPALGGATAGTLAMLERPRLEELRLSCVEGRIEAELALGRHAELVAELESLVAEHPFRERLRGQQMIALYRLGRRADALDSYRAARASLVEELGLEPGPALRELERAMLADDPDLMSGGTPPPRVVAPEQLPPDIPDFVGREGLIATLREHVAGAGAAADADGARPRGAPALIAVSGKPGAGKSALATRFAHLVRDQFPDGQLFVSLRGVESERVDPAGVLAEWLRALGAAPSEIPAELDARTRALRARLSGRRVLIVLDDAADEAQVRPLLPASGGCAVVCTSRRPLAGLEGARFVALGPLGDAEAVRLLGRLAGGARVAAEPDAAEAIARHCGYLPLAVRVAGGRLSQRDHWSLSDLATRLQDAGRRLDELRVGDLEVRASVDLSYRALDERDRSALRLLALLDGPSFAAWLAAAVLDMSLADADAALERLIDQQLLDVAGHDAAGQIRYQFHDVLADFARERLAEEDERTRHAALGRALGACLQITDALSVPIASIIPGAGARRAARWAPVDQRLEATDQASAFQWFECERAVLVAMVEVTSEVPGLASSELAANIACSFELGQRWVDWERVLEAGRRAAERDSDPVGRAMSHRGLGTYRNEIGEPAAAERHFETALQELEGLDEPDEQAAALVGLADARWGLGDAASALPLLEHALELLRELGHEARETWAIYMLGLATGSVGRLAESERHYREAGERFRRIGDTRGEAYASHALGYALQELSRTDEAAACYERARWLANEAGDGAWVAPRYGLGYARRDQGRLEEAMRELRAAYALAVEQHHKRAQMYALYGLGTTEHLRGRLAQAVAHLQHNHAIAREMGDKRSTSRALAALAAVRLDQGQLDDAASIARAAVASTAPGELPRVEAQARQMLARALSAAGDDDGAAAERERAAELERELEADAPPAPAG